MKATYRPIDSWPGERTKYPSYSPFSATWTATEQLLERELDFLKAKSIVFQLDAPERAFRLDGNLRSDARLASPAVILSFESSYGPLRYSCDRFIKWQDNMRAIALGLEALRKVERYGITKHGEQYTGWKQLGSGIAMGAAEMTHDEALDFLQASAGMESGPDYDDLDQINATYRAAAKRLHPDVGGSTEEFQRLQVALSIAQKHLGQM